MKNTEEILNGIYLFSKFDGKELSLLASKAREVILNPEATLFDEGSAAISMYVVKSGSLKITTSSREGDDVNLTLVGAGQHLGELPFLDGDKRSATVTAMEKTTLLELGYEDLRQVFASQQAMELKFYREIGGFLVKRLRVLTTDISHIREIRKRHM